MSAAEPAGSGDRLGPATDRLVRQVAHWQASRWAAAGRPGDPGGAAGAGGRTSRGDLVYALVQRLADRGAEAEGQPPRTVPRLDDLVLPDQLRVVADDLAAAATARDVLALAADDVDAVRRTL